MVPKQSVRRRRATLGSPIQANGTVSSKNDRNYQYFTAPIFMGIIAMFVIVTGIFIGATQLMATQTSDQFARKGDKPLTITEH